MLVFPFCFIGSLVLAYTGVEQDIVDYHHQKVTVTGNASEDKIFREIKKVKKRARFYVRNQDGQL